MIKTTVTFDGKQIFFNLPDKLSVELIFKSVKDYLPKSLDFNRNVIQLFDPTIREFFDLNDEGLRAWLALPIKEKNQMRLKIIPATIDGNQMQLPANNNPMSNVFEKIQQDIDFLFSAIENLQMTAKGIQNDFQIAFVKYQNSISCNTNGRVSHETAEKELHPKPVHFAAEDIRYRNGSRSENVVSIPLVSAAYQDEEEQSDDDRTESSPTSPDIEIPLLSVGEDFQALVSIAVNPSYFFIQNTFHTHDLERLAESMNEYYSNSETSSKSFRPAAMSCCAARYSVDDRWYRARVKRYNSDDTVEIVYLDYGNNEERPLNELRPLNLAFTRLPAQAICAALELLPMNNENPSSWTKKASYKFHEDTLGKPLDVRIIAQPTLQWPMYFVQLTIDEHTDVAETLISLRLAQRASLPEIIRGIGPRLDLTDYAAYNLAKEIVDQIVKKPIIQPIKQESKSKIITTLSNRISRTPKTLPELEYYLENHIGSCTITSIISPSELFIQFTEKNQFEHLYTAVHENYLQRISCDRVARLRITSVDAIGVARNPRDQRFYRVQIIKHDRERKTLHLLCVDIGEYLTVPDSSIYELLPEYEQYPAQAIQCCLGLISPVADDWSRESINFTHRQIGTRGFKSFRFYGLCASSGSIKLTDPPLPIILYDPNSMATSINEQLVDKKLALPNPEYLQMINMAKELMTDVNGYKNQRILQYIESQRNYTDSSENNLRSKETIAVVEDDENAPYCPPVIDPESRHWYAVEVTHVKTPGEFFIRFPFGIDNTLGQGKEPAPYPEEIQPNEILKDLHRSMAEFYSNEPRRGISTATPYDVGQMVAVRHQSQWHRARVLEFKSATNFAWLEFVDQGETRELGTNTMRPLHAKFLDLPLQAYLCKLEGFDSNYSWTSQDKDLFKKKIRDKIIYAKKVREPNVIQLVDLIDGEMVSFEALWRTLHQNQQKTSNGSVKVAPSTMGRTTNDSLFASGPTMKSEPVVHHLQPVFHGISQYASESEHSNLSSVLKRPSGATIPPPPPPPNQHVRMPMQFVSAGFKQSSEHGHLSPDQLLAQFQQQEGHRIQSNNGYSIRKLQRNQ